MLEPGSYADHSLPEGTPSMAGQNPFPGLRPFGIQESHLYFGREKEINDVLDKLEAHNFVAILGYSGSGKSSMMLSGVIPRLTRANPDIPVQVITTRPGVDPLENLAEAVLRHDEDHTDTPFTVSKSGLLEQLKESPLALRQILKKLNSHPAGKSLVVVDQFEELFRLLDEEDGHVASAYVDLLMHACREKNIYVAITLRSDQIGGSSRFTDLTAAINESNYLIPQLTREEKRKAIVGPVAVADAEISDALVEQLLDELEASRDQLPVLQHAMMRTWNYWHGTREEGEPIDIRHYNAIGGIAEALSQHANEAYDELTTEQKRIAEILFKSLTAKGQDNLGLRRPVQVQNVADQAEVQVEEVIEVIERFRGHGRSFLMPAEVKLTAETNVEISHESLMRIWDRLNTWVEEEHESAQMYLRLSEAAAMYQVGRTGLWRPPDLQLALNWEKKQQPTYAWAQRYEEAFERTMVFLDTSRLAFEAEQEHQELMQKRLLRRTRLAALILGIFAVIAILFFIYALLQSREAKAAAQEAEIARQEAVEQKNIAEANEERANLLAEQARLSAEEAQFQREEALRQAREALRQEQIASMAKDEALSSLRYAEEQRLIALQQEKAAIEQKTIAELRTIEANNERAKATNRLYLSVAQSMAVRSLTEDNAGIQGLMAQQAFNFNDQHEGREYDPYIYNGLFNALQTFKGENYNAVEGVLRNSARTIVMAKDGDNFYATGTQGRIIRGSLSRPNDVQIIGRNFHSNRKLLLNSSETWLINASDSSGLQMYSLLDRSLEPKVIEGHTSYVNDIRLSKQQDMFYSVGADRMIRLNSIIQGTSELILETSEEFKVIEITPDEKWLYGGTVSGKVIRVNLETRQEEKVIYQKEDIPVFALAFSAQTNMLAIGDEDGLLHLMDMTFDRIEEEITIHRGRVSALEFSSSGTLLASSSLDGTVVIYETQQWNEIPIKIADNDSYVWDLDFSPDGEYLITACGDGDLRIWPTRPALMAGELCQYLKENFTQEEWLKYVGNDLEYEITCDNLQIAP